MSPWGVGADPDIEMLWRVLDLIGVVLNGIIGATIARQRSFDVVGMLFLGLLSAVGGGIVRDLLLQRGMPVALTDPLYPAMVCIGVVLAMLVPCDGRPYDIVKTHLDAIVLGVWSVTGAAKAISYGLSLPVSIFLGMITACGGGMLRDIASGRAPLLFADNTLYAIPAFLSSWLLVVFHHAGHFGLGMILAAVFGCLGVVVCYWCDIVLPTSQAEFVRSVVVLRHRHVRTLPRVLCRRVKKKWEKLGAMNLLPDSEREIYRKIHPKLRIRKITKRNRQNGL